MTRRAAQDEGQQLKRHVNLKTDRIDYKANITSQRSETTW